MDLTSLLTGLFRKRPYRDVVVIVKDNSKVSRKAFKYIKEGNFKHYPFESESKDYNRLELPAIFVHNAKEDYSRRYFGKSGFKEFKENYPVNRN